MKASKALDMLNKNQIEELKKLLADEVYTEVLKVKPGAKDRYNAMKRYFRYSDSLREILQKPCIVDFEGEARTSICNGFSLVLTKEPCGTIELCTESDRYPPVANLAKRDGEIREIDFTKVIAEAKAKGYKLKRGEVYGNHYMMHYDGAYFRIGLLDITFGIINDGKPVTVYHKENSKRPITIENDIGTAVIMPVSTDGNFEEEVIIIEVD